MNVEKIQSLLVETGVKDGWEYVKYGDGRYEASKIMSIASGTVTQWTTGPYTTNNLTYPATPAGVTITKRKVIYSSAEGITSGVLQNGSIYQYRFIRWIAGTFTASCLFEIEGRWK